MIAIRWLGPLVALALVQALVLAGVAVQAGSSSGVGNFESPRYLLQSDDDDWGLDDDDDWDDDDDDDAPWAVSDDDDDDDDYRLVDPSVDGFRAGQAIVRLQPGADINVFSLNYGTTVLAEIPNRNLFLLSLPAMMTESMFEETLGRDPATDWAELNYVNRAPEGRPGRFYPSGGDRAVIASADEGYAPALIGVEAAHACSTGATVVAVLDTGVDDTHPDLIDRVIPGWNVLDGTPDIADVGSGRDDDGDGFIDEMTGHGTHVAGIIAQVAPDAEIMPVKVLDSDGVGDAFYLASGIYYAIDNGAQVINLSLGSTYDSDVVEEAVEEADAAGIIVVAAAGNVNRAEPEEYPAAGGAALGVASTDGNDLKSDFSNFHHMLAISAPGSAISSTFPNGGYATWSGTSMATPFVSGVAALLLDRNPDWGPAEVRAQLAATAANLDAINPDYTGLLGAGRIDAGAAVDC